MRECRRCGFPRKFASFFDWRSDGTIISTDRLHSHTQIAFLEAGELEHIFENLSNSIGLSVDPFLVKAYRNIGKTIFNNTSMRHLKHLPNNWYFRPQWLVRVFLRAISYDVAGLGNGLISLDSFRAGRHAVIRFRNPCLNALLAGSSTAIYESIEDTEDASVDFSVKDDDLVVRLAPGIDSRTEPNVEGRFYLEPTQPVKGPVKYERCPVCYSPALASLMFDWDVSRGVIMNRMSGDREVIVAVQAVNALLRELETELGESIPHLVYWQQKSLTREYLESTAVDDASRFWNSYLRDMALRGLGFPLTFRRDDSSVFVDIINAHNQVLYAAKIAGALEALTGNATEIDWEKRDSSHGTYSISTSNDA